MWWAHLSGPAAVYSDCLRFRAMPKLWPNLAALVIVMHQSVKIPSQITDAASKCSFSGARLKLRRFDVGRAVRGGGDL